MTIDRRELLGGAVGAMAAMMMTDGEAAASPSVVIMAAIAPTAPPRSSLRSMVIALPLSEAITRRDADLSFVRQHPFRGSELEEERIRRTIAVVT